MKINGKTYFIIARHERSVSNVDFDLSIERICQQVPLAKPREPKVKIGVQKAAQLFPNAKFIMISSEHGRATETSQNYKEYIGKDRVLGTIFTSLIGELDPGLEMSSDRKRIEDLYLMPNNDRTIPREFGDKGTPNFWPDYFDMNETFDAPNAFDLKPLDGESLNETKARARILKQQLTDYATTEDFRKIGIGDEAAQYLNKEVPEEIIPIFITHKGFLNCFFGEIGIVNYDHPAKKLMIPNGMPMLVSIDEKGKFAVEDFREHGFTYPDKSMQFQRTI